MKQNTYEARRAQLLFVLICIPIPCCGCLFSGDRGFATQQKLRCTVLASRSGQPVSGALVTSSFLPGYQDQPHPISVNDEIAIDTSADLREPNTGTTGQHGQVDILCFTVSDPGWFFGLDKHWNDVTGKHWGFRVEAENQREYFSIFPMRLGAVGVGERFTLRIDEIGRPTQRNRR
jgi:hypothetical protein